ncbi:glycosyltransferase [Stygiolobus caldivivus]|uniref:Glycosyl transferase family 2 n=1 Tax=Stygiolobus caldivivus TaxID=2824673 RepID=A0A8D5U926_9CREN|nr:glycosyltransferase family 2 protein [Stygiolobus caldivivus]BCU71300.1 glycosyl transferase family 2 [Stygiolobus caldivivus]
MLTLLLQVLLFVYPSIFIIYQLVLYKRSNKILVLNQNLKDTNLPFLSIIVPTKGESIEVLQGLINNVNELVWDKRKLEVIIVSDDSEDYFNELVNKLSIPSDLDVKIFRREKKLGYKSGALLYGYERAKGQLILTIDVDSRLPKDALIKAYAKMVTGNCDAVVFEWTGYTNNNYSSLAKGLIATTVLASKALFKGKESLGLRPFPVGSGTLFKKEVLDELDGWDYKLIQDDLEIGARMAYLGKKVCASGVPIYIEVPDNLYGFYVQQTRWALGTGEVLRNRIRHIINSPYSFTQKFDMIFHLLQYTPIILTFILATLISLLSPFVKGDILRTPLFLVWIATVIGYATTLFILALRLGLGFKNSIMAIGRLTAFTVAISPFITISFLKGIISRNKIYIVTPKGANQTSFQVKVRRIIAVIAMLGILYLLASIIYLIHNYFITGIWLLYYSSGYIYTWLTYDKEL